MGTFTTRRVCGSTISFERPRINSEADLPRFSGKISCCPVYDTSGEEALDWEGLDNDLERGMDQTHDR